MAKMYEHNSECERGHESKPAQDPEAFNPLRLCMLGGIIDFDLHGNR
jgi:hypothetical protein